MIKKLVKKALPDSLVRNIKLLKKKKIYEKAYMYDLERYLAYSNSKEKKSEDNVIANIIKRYHVIEKGLTMPNMRAGFGKGILIELIQFCEIYINNYETSDQLLFALSIIQEYVEVHKKMNFQFDEELQFAIDSLNNNPKFKVLKISSSRQLVFSNYSYFQHVNASFTDFANSRHSLRNFDNIEINKHDLLNAFRLAQTAPSACNRQSTRIYLFEDKHKIESILEVQGGNRGFGHLANKLILITGNVSFFGGILERNQVFIDGGIYAMNMLYSLHANKIGACILNCSNSIEKDKKLRELCDIKESEVFIAFIACGIPPKEFKVASSPRYNLSSTLINK